MEATTRRSGWPRLYFDSIEHLLNYPDWIERLKADGTKKPIRMVMNRLETLEAPLHHAVEKQGDLHGTVVDHSPIRDVLAAREKNDKSNEGRSRRRAPDGRAGTPDVSVA